MKARASVAVKIAELLHYRTADDVHMILSFMDELRDAIWEAHGAEIVEQHHKTSEPSASINDRQLWLPGLDMGIER